ncbi:hypothetical protein GBA63_14710 [Rubrobacter tropicus]|uniref:Uncharacterized protein n=1 Tax=Rubrobacter tropicus TaxID=2653851 RepID=A0A6G8QB82_9ACTN|nr:hypothetical protein [Rubrobacter tropicus]QIN83745.1 hypothetical protein GBA63_14710 [Rubrobacter tropicus]
MLSDGPQAARFEFEAEEVKQDPEPKPEPEAAEKEEDPGPSVRPGYSLVGDPSGSLSVEVPSSWSCETGEDSEGPGGENSWSYYAGEYLSASITTARSLDAWYGPASDSKGSGAYMVASETLANQYTDDELIYSLLHQKKQTNCTAGPSQEIDHPPYSGKVQTWFDCNGLGTDYYVFAAAPEGRACVVVGGARVVAGASGADQDAVEHIVDSFEVDCGSLPPSAPLESEATNSASASASSTPSASPEPSDLSCEEIQAILNSEAPGIEALTPEELLACGLSPEAIDPCEGNPDPNCGENLPEGSYPSINGPESPEPSSPEPSSPEPSSPEPSSPDPSSPPSAGGDIDCDEVDGPIETPPGDPDNLDGDGDGLACE